MACKCGGERIISVSAKSSDMCGVMYKGVEYVGYAPQGIGISTEVDYVSFELCMDCGRVQNFVSPDEAALMLALEGDSN